MSANPLVLCCPGCHLPLSSRPGECLSCVRCGPVPPVQPATVPAFPEGQTAARPRGGTIPAWGLCLVLILVAGAVWWWMRSQAEASAATWANQLAAARMDAARAHMQQDQWDDAIRILHEARALDRASCGDEVQALLNRAEQGLADALLRGARQATLQRDPARARQLLHAYRQHPRATEREAATSLEDEIQHALSDQEARQWLRDLPEPMLAQVAQQDYSGERITLSDPGARLLFLDTARRHLPEELRRRQQLQEAARQDIARKEAERRRLEARLRSSAEFRVLADFVARTRAGYRQQQELAQQQEKALQELYRQLKIDGAQQQEVRRQLLDDAGERRAREDALAAQRSAAKQACRRAGIFSRAEIAVFDEMVDREVDDLLREMAAP